MNTKTKQGMKTKTNKAFTLIELLVVIAIIGILAGLLLPTLARAKMVAKSAQNKNNLKQIAGAFSMYSDDHGGLAVGIGESSGRYFFGQYNGVGSEVDYSGGYLSEYVNHSERVWQDPVFNAFSKRGKKRTCSYAFNSHYLNEMEENGNWWDPGYSYVYRGLDTQIMESPVETVLFGDSARNWMGPVEENWFWTPPSQARAWPGWETAYTHFRHNGKATVLWGDGHVEMVAPDQTYPVNDDQLGYICDTNDRFFKPVK